MTNIKRKGDRLSDEKRRQAISELIRFFENERDEEIGRVAAEQLLNFFLDTVGPAIYNSGIEDAKSALASRVDELNYDLDELMDM